MFRGMFGKKTLQPVSCEHLAEWYELGALHRIELGIRKQMIEALSVESERMVNPGARLDFYESVIGPETKKLRDRCREMRNELDQREPPTETSHLNQLLCEVLELHYGIFDALMNGRGHEALAIQRNVPRLMSRVSKEDIRLFKLCPILETVFANAEEIYERKVSAN